MKKKLLVLCGERPTINETGERIDTNGNVLTKHDGKYKNSEGNDVQVNESKNVIDIVQLLNNKQLELNDTDILYVDWETLLDSDERKDLEEIAEYGALIERIPPKFVRKHSEKPSLMKKVYIDKLIKMERYGERPSNHFKIYAMEEFMETFSKILQKNGVVLILPTLPSKDGEEINTRRMKLLKGWEYEQKQKQVKVLQPLSYTNYEEVCTKAQEEAENLPNSGYNKNQTTQKGIEL